MDLESKNCISIEIIKKSKRPRVKNFCLPIHIYPNTYFSKDLADKWHGENSVEETLEFLVTKYESFQVIDTMEDYLTDCLLEALTITGNSIDKDISWAYQRIKGARIKHSLTNNFFIVSRSEIIDWIIAVSILLLILISFLWLYHNL